MAKTLQNVVAVQDESCHWFVIPADREDEFFRDHGDEEFIDSGEFDEKWSKYMTGGGVNNIQLWAEIE